MSMLSLPALIRGRHINDSFQMPASEWQRRRQALCDLLVEKQLEGCILYADSLCNGYVEYFTNYNAVITWSNSMLLITREGVVTLLAAVPGRDLERVPTFLAPDVELELVGMNLVANDHVGRAVVEHIRKKGLPGSGWGGINLDWCPLRGREDLQAGLGDIVDLTPAFERIRRQKSNAELSILSQAAALAHAGCIELARACASEADEAEASASVNRKLRYAGAEDVQILLSSVSLGGALRFPLKRPFEKGGQIKLYVEVQYLRYKAIYGMTTVAGAPADALAADATGILRVYHGLAERCQVGKPTPPNWREEAGLPNGAYSDICGIGMDLQEPLGTAEPLAANTVLGVTLDEGETGLFMADTLVLTPQGLQSLGSLIHTMEIGTDQINHNKS